MLKLSSIPMHILNLIAEEKSKLANKWKTTFCSLMKGNMGIQKHSKLFVSLEREKKKGKRQVPQVRISILTGTAFAVQCSTH